MPFIFWRIYGVCSKSILLVAEDILVLIVIQACCVCLFAYLRVCLYACLCACAPTADFGCLFLSLSTLLCWDRASHWSIQFQLAWLALELRHCPVFACQLLGFQAHAATPAFFCDSEELNSELLSDWIINLSSPKN